MMHDVGVAKPTKLYASDVATRLGIARTTWTSYVSRSLPRGNPAPAPDGVDIERGHAKPWWKPSTITAWERRRPSSPGRSDAG
jgi:hypothetical protein